VYRIARWQPGWSAWWQRGWSARAENIVTNSSAVGDWFSTRDVPPENIVLIPPGVQPARDSGISRSQLLQELRLPRNARLIGVVGRLVPEKRVQDLIWAADLLRVLHDNLRVLIIGEGPLRSQLEQYALKASDLDHIRILGQREDVWRIMPHLDVLWNSDDNHGVSIAMLEAMAAGVPVVASDVPVNREVVIHGQTGFLVPISVRSGRADRARVTNQLFTDRELSSRISTAARQRIAERFSCEQMIRRQSAVYAEQPR
jgi:glycosyltransferase involved in cell wall biosynthesis